MIEDYDRGGLPYERTLTRLGYARWLLAVGRIEEAQAVNAIARALAQRHSMAIVEADAWTVEAELVRRNGADGFVETASAARLRQATGYHGPDRP